MKRKYNWMFGLFLFGTWACTAQSKEVHLHGSLKEFGTSEVKMDLHGILGDISEMHSIVIPVEKDGTFDLRFPLDKPTYFQIGRNTLYLTPGDDMKVYLGTSQEQSTFQGKGMEANTYLKGRLFPKGGSFLKAGRNVQSTYEATKRVVDSLAQIRIGELNALENVSDEFKEIEAMRIEADRINSYSAFTWYCEEFLQELMKDVKSEEEAEQRIRKHQESVAGDFNPILKQLASSEVCWEAEVVRDMLLTCMEEDYYDFPRSEHLKEMGEVVQRGWEMEEAALTQETYNKFKDFAGNLKNKEYAEAFLWRLELRAKLMEGRPAIDLDIKTPDGKAGKLSDYKGKVMYVDFWATWCAPCMGEMPYFNELSKKYPNIQFIGISVDDDESAWQSRLKSGDHGAVIEVICHDSRTNTGWDVTGIPRFLLIDENFNIISSDAPRPSQKDIIEPLLEKYNSSK